MQNISRHTGFWIYIYSYSTVVIQVTQLTAWQSLRVKIVETKKTIILEVLYLKGKELRGDYATVCEQELEVAILNT